MKSRARITDNSRKTRDKRGKMRNSKGISPWKFGRELSANHARVIFGSANNELPGNNPTNGGIGGHAGEAPANRARIHGEFIFSRRALTGVLPPPITCSILPRATRWRGRQVVIADGDRTGRPGCARRVTHVTDLSLAGIERHRARPTNQHLCVTCVTVRVCAKDS